MLNGHQVLEIDIVAKPRACRLYPCHAQLHMDFAFMPLSTAGDPPRLEGLMDRRPARVAGRDRTTIRPVSDLERAHGQGPAGGPDGACGLAATEASHW
jgi:hypothetical protein